MDSKKISINDTAYAAAAREAQRHGWSITRVVNESILRYCNLPERTGEIAEIPYLLSSILVDTGGKAPEPGFLVFEAGPKPTA